jgi:hypothetical protein
VILGIIGMGHLMPTMRQLNAQANLEWVPCIIMNQQSHRPMFHRRVDQEVSAM